MTSLLGWRRRRGVDLGERLSALQEAAGTLRGRVPDEVLGQVDALVERAGQRAALGADRTVVALAGSTGSGKSSLFNAVVGFDLAVTGPRRPTTSQTLACVFGEEGSGPLVDWLGVPPARRVARESELGPAPSSLEGLVLLDLPDHDSLVQAHRQEVDRLVGLVDLLVWVVDPQKYADALLHEAYLRTMTAHGAVVVVVLNQVDRLDGREQEMCLRDLGALLAADGLADVPVVATSATTGQGMRDLQRLLERAVRTRRTATERLAADVSALAWRLATEAGLDEEVREGAPPVDGARPDAEDALVDAVTAAVGADALADVVEGVQRRRAQDAVGWTGSRLVRRFTRAAPPTTGDDVVALAATDAPAVVQARVDLAVRAYVEDAAGGLPAAWVRRAQQRVDATGDGVPEALIRQVVDVAARPVPPPRWWTLQRLAQTAAFATAIVGLVWIVVLVVLGIGRAQVPGAPTIEGVPWPAALLLGGVLLSVVLSLLARAAPARWAARVRERVVREVREQVRDGLAPSVVEPVRGEILARDSALRALLHAVG